VSYFKSGSKVVEQTQFVTDKQTQTKTICLTLYGRHNYLKLTYCDI